jgi:hypothetical protein
LNCRCGVFGGVAASFGIFSPGALVTANATATVVVFDKRVLLVSSFFPFPLQLTGRSLLQSTLCTAQVVAETQANMPITFNRSSGLDFSDRNNRLTALEQHPDLSTTYTNGTTQPSHLQRNKTERRRLQDLQRTNSISPPKSNVEPRNLHQKWDHWMINDGGRRMFFGVWILLHMLVFALGFINYQLKDNSVNARKEFGITFSTLRYH